MFNDIFTAIEKSEASILGSTNKKDFLVKREIVNSSLQNNIFLQIKFTNLSTKPINVKSVILTDFEIDLNKDKVNSVLQNAWTQSGRCTYIKKITPTRRNQLFLNRDQNPNSFQSQYGYVKNSLISEWFTKINFANKSLFIGALTTKKQYC